MGAAAKPFGAQSLDSLVGESTWMRRLHGDIQKLAGHSSTVFIAGPSGTGKELIARAIHSLSARAEKPLIPVDCAAISGTLFASHMFGHVKGAFTGATHAALGCFRAADGGTIFLDEIGELDLEWQAKLLRVLQQRMVVPFGSHVECPVDVRIISATNRDLRREVAAGRFRADLYYRLSVVTIATIPLCQRRSDIPHLVEHTLARLAVQHGLPHKALSPEALELAQRYDWPGNVRELENVLEQAVLFSESSLIDAVTLRTLLSESPADLTFADGEPNQSPAPVDAQETATFSAEAWRTMAEIEAEHIRRTLEHTFGNQSAAARLLEMDRNLLRRKMRRYGLLGETPPPRRPR